MVSIVCQISIQKIPPFSGWNPQEKIPRILTEKFGFIHPTGFGANPTPKLRWFIWVYHKPFLFFGDFSQTKRFTQKWPKDSPFHNSNKKKKHRERPRRPWNLWIYLFPASKDDEIGGQTIHMDSTELRLVSELKVPKSGFLLKHELSFWFRPRDEKQPRTF